MAVKFNRKQLLFFIDDFGTNVSVEVLRKRMAGAYNISPLVYNIRGGCSVALSKMFGQWVLLF